MELRIQLRLPSRHLSAEHHFYESSTHWKVHPTPGAIEAGSSKRATRTRQADPSTPTPRRPTPSADAARTCGRLRSIHPRSPGAGRSSRGAPDRCLGRVERDTRPACGGGPNRALRTALRRRAHSTASAGAIAPSPAPFWMRDAAQSICIVTAGIYELRGNCRMERGAYPPHVIAVNRDTRPYLDDIA